MAQLTLSSFQKFPSSNYPGSSCVLRIWYSRSFIDSDGTAVNGGPGFYKSITCTISSGVVTVPSTVDALFTTLDAEDPHPQTIAVRARFYIRNNTQAADWVFSGNGTSDSGWVIYNPDPLTSVTYEQLALYNQSFYIVNPNQDFWTSQQVIEYVNTQFGQNANASDVIKGITKLSVAPTLSTNPIAVGKNDYATTSNNGIARASVAPVSSIAPIFTGTNDRRMQEMYNVTATAIGANGNGVFDNVSVLDTLVNTTMQITGAGGDVYFPAGTYLIGSDMSFPANVRLNFDPRAKLKIGTGQVVTIVGAVNADPYQVFTNATAGLGTIRFTGNRKIRIIYPEWWGAVGDGSTDCFASIQAAELALETLKSGVLIFGAGTYAVSSSVQIFNVEGITWLGAGPDHTVITNTGTHPAVQTNGVWRSLFQGLFFNASGTITSGQGLFELDGSVPATSGHGVQGVQFQNCIFAANQLADYSFFLLRQGASGGQGDHTKFFGCYFSGGLERCYIQTGFNALNTGFYNCDFQSYRKDGAYCIAGSFNFFNCTFESGYGAAQVTNSGFDIHCGESGVFEPISVIGCRSESLQFFKGSASQPAILIGNQQAVGAVGGWPGPNPAHNVLGATNASPIVITADVSGWVNGDLVTIASVGGNTAANGVWTITLLTPTTFSLNGSAGNGAYTSGGTSQVTQRVGTATLQLVGTGYAAAYKLFVITTQGILGASEPVWPTSGTVADGTAVWTQTTFWGVDATTISGGGIGANVPITLISNGFLTQTIGSWRNFPFITATADLTIQLFAGTESGSPLEVLVDTTSGPIIITVPKLPGGQILNIKKVTSDANAVTITGSSTTIDGAASIIIPGSTKGWVVLQVRSNNWAVVSKSFALDSSGSALTVSSNIITPTNTVHQVGAGLIKFITVPAGFLSGNSIQLIPTAVFTTDASGNVSKATTAIIGQVMTVTLLGSTWYPSY